MKTTTMKKETAPKKTWQKPEVQDLDVRNTETKFPTTTENAFSGPAS